MRAILTFLVLTCDNYVDFKNKLTLNKIRQNFVKLQNFKKLYLKNYKSYISCFDSNSLQFLLALKT